MPKGIHWPSASSVQWLLHVAFLSDNDVSKNGVIVKITDLYAALLENNCSPKYEQEVVNVLRSRAPPSAYVCVLRVPESFNMNVLPMARACSERRPKPLTIQTFGRDVLDTGSALARPLRMHRTSQHWKTRTNVHPSSWI